METMYELIMINIYKEYTTTFIQPQLTKRHVTTYIEIMYLFLKWDNIFSWCRDSVATYDKCSIAIYEEII